MAERFVDLKQIPCDADTVHCAIYKIDVDKPRILGTLEHASCPAVPPLFLHHAPPTHLIHAHNASSLDRLL